MISRFLKNTLTCVIMLLIIGFVKSLFPSSSDHLNSYNSAKHDYGGISYMPYKDILKVINVDSVFSFIKKDSLWGAQYYKFIKQDSCLYVYVSPKFDYTDSILLSQKLYQIGYRYNIEKSSNISGLALMRILSKKESKNGKKLPPFICGLYKPNSQCELEFTFLAIAAEAK